MFRYLHTEWNTKSLTIHWYIFLHIFLQLVPQRIEAQFVTKVKIKFFFKFLESYLFLSFSFLILQRLLTETHPFSTLFSRNIKRKDVTLT